MKSTQPFGAEERPFDIPAAAIASGLSEADILEALIDGQLPTCIRFFKKAPGRLVSGDRDSPDFGKTKTLFGTYSLLVRDGGMNLLDSAISQLRHGITSDPHPRRSDTIWVQRGDFIYALTIELQGRHADAFEIAQELPPGAILAIRREDLTKFIASRQLQETGMRCSASEFSSTEATSQAAPAVAAQATSVERMNGTATQARTLSTDEVCTAFSGIGWDSPGWRNQLTKNRPAWLKSCSAAIGKPGAKPVQGQWYPLKIAEAMVMGRSRKYGVIPATKLDAAFRTQNLLRHSANDWNNLRADNPLWGE